MRKVDEIKDKIDQISESDDKTVIIKNMKCRYR